MSLRRPNDLTDKLNNLFYDFDETLFPSSVFGTTHPLLRKGREALAPRNFMPPVEMVEKENEYIVRAEAPGINPEDIDVEVMGETLTISGETKSQHEEKGEQIHSSEFTYGTFLRRIPLPANAKSEGVRADFHNGVLEVHVPKTRGEKRQKVKVDINK